MSFLEDPNSSIYVSAYNYSFALKNLHKYIRKLTQLLKNRQWTQITIKINTKICLKILLKQGAFKNLSDIYFSDAKFKR